MPTTDCLPRPRTGLAETVRALLRGWRERQLMRRHLTDIGEQEADRMLRDSGVSRLEAAGWLNAPFAAEDLAGRMMAKLGVSSAEARRSDPMVMRDIERVCMACRSRRRCRRSLERGQPSAEYKAFCPNATTFEALRVADVPRDWLLEAV